MIVKRESERDVLSVQHLLRISRCPVSCTDSILADSPDLCS